MLPSQRETRDGVIRHVEGARGSSTSTASATKREHDGDSKEATCTEAPASKFAKPAEETSWDYITKKFAEGRDDDHNPTPYQLNI